MFNQLRLFLKEEKEKEKKERVDPRVQQRLDNSFYYRAYCSLCGEKMRVTAAALLSDLPYICLSCSKDIPPPNYRLTKRQGHKIKA